MNSKYLLYFLSHGLVHLLLVALIFFVFRLGLSGLILVFLSSAIIDADHLPFIKKRGVNWWVKDWGSHAAKSFPLHNFFTMLLFSTTSLLVFIPCLFIIGICSLSITLHLLWDFIEDVFIFKMGDKHWGF